MKNQSKNKMQDLEKQMDKMLQKIKEKRKEKGYSIEYMGIQLNISPSAYLKIERGETELTVRRLLEIQQILELPLQDLFDLKTIFNHYQEIKDNATGTFQIIEHLETLNQFNKELLELLLNEHKQIIEQYKKENEILKQKLNK